MAGFQNLAESFPRGVEAVIGADIMPLAFEGDVVISPGSNVLVPGYFSPSL